MTSLKAIEAALQQLDPAGRAQFRAWFERFDAADWDQQLQNDVEAGALDWLAEEALAEQKEGRCRQL
jgi:ABC-type Zn uptake system ZnuABC Zn-binding protein ZnuA